MSAQQNTLPMSRFRRVPLAELTTPKDGKIVYTDRWWAVTENDEALFYVGENRKWNSPQCNHNRAVIDGVLLAGCKAVFVPIAYLEAQGR